MDAVEKIKTEMTNSPPEEESTQTALANQSDLSQREEEEVDHPSPPKKRSVAGWLARLVCLTGLTTVTACVVWEMQTSWLQAHLLSRYAPTLTWQVETGPSDAILFPANGPVDKRQGYARLPQLSERLSSRGFNIEQQARFSPPLLEYANKGLFIPYDEKSQTGITILDCTGSPFYLSRYPHYQYADFATIPNLVLQALLFIENRDLLSEAYPMTNPAIDWPRFGNAVVSQLGKQLGIQDHGSGGSTLATQMEKFRHSPDGRTNSGTEKLRQMASASVRAYRHGPLTHAAREKLALDYLNSVPLAAAPGYGEVHGLGDGLHTWFAADVARSNALLNQSVNQQGALAEQGLALRQVLALLIAHRRPSFYLLQGRAELATLTDSYLRLLAQQGIIPPTLRDAALDQPLSFRNFVQAPAFNKIDSDKARYVARGRLSNMLGLSLYDLDHLDLTAQSELNYPLQQEVSAYLKRLADPLFAGEVGLFGERLLSPEKTSHVRYSFTLFEQGDDGFKVRVQTDNTNLPFDINESSKLELGSTAKLRVLTTYLQIVAELHQRYGSLPSTTLRQQTIVPQDNLTRWALDYLSSSPDRQLRPMLLAAMERRYSASPGESFFTGGGLHTFANFRREDNGRLPTLQEALQESINLPFVRLLRDVVRYSLYQNPDRATLLSDDKDPRRQEYLRRFADREGKTYLWRFWRKYQGKNSQEQLQTMVGDMRLTQTRLAAVHRYLFPEASTAELAKFIRQHLPGVALGDKQLTRLYQTLGPGGYSLPDQGYVARVHPLDLWLLGYRLSHPEASFSDAVAASQSQRLEVYGWLFNSRHRSARDSRIRTMLEIEAFADIHQRWQKVGYPFDHLVPSLATAIGSSGDRPAALAELMGIIQNYGVRLPVQRIDSLHFAAATPYETKFGAMANPGERVLPSEVASVLREALAKVVELGTARRLAGSIMLPDGTPLTLGGKTGTGDNRLETVGRSGHVITSKVLNRTATFVFYLGEHHFGTLTAYVEGGSADKFRFTSALPVQVLKGMAPLLSPYLEPQTQTQCQKPAPGVQRPTQSPPWLSQGGREGLQTGTPHS